jgi:hypothetical protein
LNLELHKRTTRQLQEELTSRAEVWEKELEERYRLELENEEGLEHEVVEESLVSDDWEKVVHRQHHIEVDGEVLD